MKVIITTSKIGVVEHIYIQANLGEILRIYQDAKLKKLISILIQL